MFKKITLLVLVICAIMGFVFRKKLTLMEYAFMSTSNSKTQSFYINKKLTVKGLASVLKEQGIVKSEKAIVALGNYKKLNKNSIALGKYEIKPHTSFRHLLNGFRLNALGNGNAEVAVDVVVPSVRFLEDLAGKLASNTMVDSAELMQLIHSESIKEKYALSKENVLSLFVPNTYKMYYDTDAKQFVARMEKEYQKFWTDERRSQLQKIGLSTPDEAVTLASIVYSEQSKKPSEWPTIAGLYLNRIQQGIPLQSDPTFKFCWGKELDTVQRLLKKHRNIDCPYNTYFIKGLPPGPICLTPLSVVDAVLHPKKHDYIFMVAEPSYSGKHLFTKTYKEHKANADKFQNWLAKELAKKK